MIRALAIVCALTACAVADPYYFAKGSIIHHECSSADRDWLAEWTSFGTLELTDMSTAITLKGITHVSSGPERVPPYAFFELAPHIQMVARIDLADCADKHCKTINATVSLINRGDGSRLCFDQWRGVIARDDSDSNR